MATVLIVDDEPDIRTIISLSLDGEEFELRTAASGRAALEALVDCPPELMILDIMMPGMSGFEVLATMRERGLAPSTRIVVTTCRTSEGDHVRGMELGADEYLTKPFDPEELVDKLRALLAASPEMLRVRRAAELEKAALLDRMEAAVSNPGRHSATGA
ncbi:MAG TPA: response regulator [Acidimicrobiales bacterium]|jgi:DNA-binding response OmpR family regulator|nr:response regulator [Acidimicrobiales bacterium]